MSVLIQLFTSFFTIGLFGFGGGYAILSFLQQEVERQGWMNTERFADLIAISQSTPGPIAINMATFVGYQVSGVPGALVATLAVVLPGSVLVMVLMLFFFHFYERPVMQSVFAGLRPAVVGLIAAAAWQIGRIAMTHTTEAGQRSVSVVAIIIAVMSCILIARWKVHPVLLVLASAIAGIIFL